MDNQRGISLAELLIALSLASFMLIILMQHYLQAKRQYHMVQEAIDQQLELHMVTDLIRHSIRSAGFTPCSSIEHLITSVPIPSINVEGHSLQLNRMSESFNTVTEVLNPTHVLAMSHHLFHKDDIVLLADCYHAEVSKIYQVTSTGKEQFLTFTQPLRFNYVEPIYIGSWLEETFIFKKTLFYRQRHMDELAAFVRRFSVQKEGLDLIVISLGLKNGEEIELKTRQRIL